jgi:hypothetical protein
LETYQLFLDTLLLQLTRQRPVADGRAGRQLRGFEELDPAYTCLMQVRRQA